MPEENWKPSGSKQMAEDLLKRLAQLESERQPFESVYDDVAEYMGLAYKGFATRDTKGKKYPQAEDPAIADSTSKRAASTFSAGMLSGLSSPSNRWFSLTTGDKDLDNWPDTRGWLQNLEDAYYEDLARAYFYPQQHLAYHQTGLFGWQCLYLDESPLQGIRFNVRPLNEVYIAEDHLGLVDTVFRVFELTIRQAAQKWGKDNLSKKTQEKLRGSDKQMDEKITVVHAVMPREDFDEGRMDTRGLPFASWYLEKEERHVIIEGGYNEMPYLVSRFFKLPGTPYSYSPGTEALADVKMINEMKNLILEAGQLSMAPPYLVPDDGFLGNFSYEPWAINKYRRGDGGGAAQDFRPLEIGGDPRFGLDLLMATKQDINEAFFVDLFRTIRQRVDNGSTPTAAEVAELSEEKMFLLGPMIIRQQRENFDALFDRMFMLKLRRGEIAPLPKELAGREIKADYVSPLALAQKEQKTRAILSTYLDIQAIAQVAPEVFDLFDHDENVRRIARQRGFPQTGLRPMEQVGVLRQQRAQQMQAQQVAAMAGEAADKYPGLAKVPEEGSPADGLLKALGGAQ